MTRSILRPAVLSVAALIAVAFTSAPAAAQVSTITPMPNPGGNYFLGVYTQPVPAGPVYGPVNGPFNNPVSGPVPAVVPGFNPPGTPGGGMALQVTGVVPNSPAARVGLEYGDVIFRANGQTLANQWQLKNAIQTSGGYLNLLVRCVRTGQTRPLTVTMGGGQSPVMMNQ